MDDLPYPELFGEIEGDFLLYAFKSVIESCLRIAIDDLYEWMRVLWKVDYSQTASKTLHSSYNNGITEIDHYYSMFTGIHIMMYVGFGYLMTFVKTYGFGAIGLNFLISAVGLQWAILTNAFFDVLINQKPLTDSI